MAGDSATRNAASSLGPLGSPSQLQRKDGRSRSVPHMLHERVPKKNSKDLPDRIVESPSGTPTGSSSLGSPVVTRSTNRRHSLGSLKIASEKGMGLSPTSTANEGSQARLSSTLNLKRPSKERSVARIRSIDSEASTTFGNSAFSAEDTFGRLVSGASSRRMSSKGSKESVTRTGRKGGSKEAVARRKVTAMSLTAPISKSSGWIRMAESFLLREVSRDYGLPLEDMLIPAYRVFKDVATVPESISAFASIMRDGLLNRSGFSTLLRKLAGNNADDIQMDLAIESAYRNNDGSEVESLRFAEFACWLNAHAFDEFMSTEEAAERLQNRDICMEFGLNLVEVENYRSDFKKFDLDQTGVICKSEFAAMLSSLTKVKLNDIPASRVKMWWQSADMDRNGSICFKEFIMFHRKFFHSDGMGGTYIADDFYAFAGPAGARISRFNY